MALDLGVIWFLECDSCSWKAEVHPSDQDGPLKVAQHHVEEYDDKESTYLNKDHQVRFWQKSTLSWNDWT